MQITIEKQKAARVSQVKSPAALLNAMPYILCRSCTGFEDCTYPKDASRPIYHCAEFKPFAARTGNGGGKHIRTAAKPKAAAPQTAKGLCTNCEKTGDCSYAARGGYILCCEEYE